MLPNAPTKLQVNYLQKMDFPHIWDIMQHFSQIAYIESITVEIMPRLIWIPDSLFYIYYCLSEITHDPLFRGAIMFFVHSVLLPDYSFPKMVQDGMWSINAGILLSQRVPCIKLMWSIIVS